MLEMLDRREARPVAASWEVVLSLPPPPPPLLLPLLIRPLLPQSHLPGGCGSRCDLN